MNTYHCRSWFASHYSAICIETRIIPQNTTITPLCSDIWTFVMNIFLKLECNFASLKFNFKSSMRRAFFYVLRISFLSQYSECEVKICIAQTQYFEGSIRIDHRESDVEQAVNFIWKHSNDSSKDELKYFIWSSISFSSIMDYRNVLKLNKILTFSS